MADEKTGVARWNETEGGAPSPKRRRGTEEKKRYLVLTILALILAVVGVVLAMPPAEKIKGSLYFSGGTETTLEAKGAQGSDVDASQVAGATSLIKSRLNAAGATESKVVSEGTTITVDVPRDFNAKDILPIVGGNGNLEFIVVDEIGDADAVEAISQGSHNAVMAEGTYEPFMDGTHVKDVVVQSVSSDSTYLSFSFDDEGSKIFAEKTKQVAEEQGAIAIALDRRVIAAASVSEEITGGGVSVGTDYTAAEANAIRAVATGEKLGFDCEVGESTDIDALLGSNITTTLAGAVGVLCLVFFVLVFVRYKRLAFVAGGTVIVFFCLLFGMMALFSRFNMFVLTVPGAIAGAIGSLVVILAAWRLVSFFSDHVSQGGTIRGGSVSAPREGLRIFIAPAILYLIVGCVFQFLPQMALREFGLMAIYAVVSGVIAIVCFGTCLLRQMAGGAIQENPEAWGVRKSIAAAAQ